MTKLRAGGIILLFIALPALITIINEIVEDSPVKLPINETLNQLVEAQETVSDFQKIRAFIPLISAIIIFIVSVITYFFSRRQENWGA